jgi:hypothetical protein
MESISLRQTITPDATAVNDDMANRAIWGGSGHCPNRWGHRAAMSPSPSTASGDGTNVQGGHAGPSVPPAGTRAGTAQRAIPTSGGGSVNYQPNR